MHISKLSLRNFRNFQASTFHFQAGVNSLIGENGAGKTNAFEAIRLLVDGSLPKNAIDLEETDFSRSIGGWRGHWIIISLELENLDQSESCQLLAYGAGHMEEGQNKGRYTLYFRPKYGIRKELFSKSGDPDSIEQIRNGITIDDYETIFTCRGNHNFTQNAFYSMYVGDFTNFIFPDPDELQKDVYGDTLPSQFNFTREVTCTFVKALRDVVSDIKSSRTNPLLKLLKSQANKLIQHGHITDQITQLNSAISELDEIATLSNGIQQSLKNTVGTTYAPRIEIKSELPDDMDKLLYSLTLWVGDTNDGLHQGRIRELSLGGANLIYLSLKLLEYEYGISLDKAAHFLLIEEPEAHIHTHIQKTLFERYKYRNTQVIISTHSTHISSASKISSVNILAKGDQEAHVYQPSNGLDEDECKKIERYLDAVRSTLLFARGVVLVEGDAELILIPAMVKAAFGVSLDEIGISLINMNSAVFANIAKLFHDNRIRRKCAIITDLDVSIVPLSADQGDDDDYQKKCRNSEVKGAERKRNLDVFCRGNQWVAPYYADHTFEVDFLKQGNAKFVEACIDEMYSRTHERNASINLINDKNVAISGREILRLADRQGKGWFALHISEQLDWTARIPNYILNALSFAGNHITDLNWESMAHFRIEQGVNANDQRFIDLKAIVTGINGEYIGRRELLEQYRLNITEDTLTDFMNSYDGGTRYAP